jgi:hypothetical protein
MITLSSFKSIEELDKHYSELRDSLKVSGLPYDDGSLLGAWAEAVRDFEAAQNARRDFTSL